MIEMRWVKRVIGYDNDDIGIIGDVLQFRQTDGNWTDSTGRTYDSGMTAWEDVEFQDEE